MRVVLIICMIAILGSVWMPSIASSQEEWGIEDVLKLIDNAPELKLAQIQLNNAQSAFNTALSAFSPQLNGGIGYSKGEESVTTNLGGTIIQPFEGGKATLSLTQIINEDSPAGLALFKAQRELYKAKNTFNTTKKNLEIKIIDQFYNALFAQRQLEIAKDNLILAQKKLKMAEDQFSAKAITESSFMDAQLSVNDSQINLNSAQSNAELALLTLFNTLGIAPKDVKLKGDFTYNPSELSLDDLIKEAISNNLDLKNAQFSLEEAERAYREALKSDTTISLSGSYSPQNGHDLSVSIDSKNYQLGLSYSFPVGNYEGSNTSNTWSIGISLSTPIFDGGSKTETIKQAELQVEQAKVNLENTRKSVELSVRQNYQTVMSNKEQVERAKLNLSQKDLIVKNQEARFKLGLITQLDLDSANIQLNQAKLDMDKAIVNYKVSLLQLELILGKE